MEIYYAKDLGIVPGIDITVKLKEFLESIANNKQEKRLEFEYGTYYITANDTAQDFLYMTNTCADYEWKKSETPYLAKIAIYLNNISNFTINGNGSTFVIQGQCTNIAIQNSSGIKIENLEIKVDNPNLHEFLVVKNGLFFADFEIDRDTLFKIKNKKLYFLGLDYCDRANKKASYSWWNGMSPKSDPNAVWRVRHPFSGAAAFKEIAPYIIRVYFIHNRKFEVGSRFYVFDKRRNNAGIFINESKNIELAQISQRFNYGLAVVAQVSENILMHNLDFSPCPKSSKNFCSVADFIQICECKGDVIIKDNNFVGAGDDCLNVHGVHFKVERIENKSVYVSFQHHETKGYNPFKIGEIIEFIDRYDLLPRGRGAVVSSELLDDMKTIKLELDNIEGLKSGQVVDNISRHPRLIFENNFMTRIITRGILITTSAPSIVSKNTFDNTTMHSILCSNDANNWFESGRVLDLTIEENVFNTCRDKYTICIKPENKNHAGFVHDNIKIINNIINEKNAGLYLKSTGNVSFIDNKINGETFNKHIQNSELME